jgi:hypothetical protein
MRSDVRALLRPLVKTVGLLLAVALGVVACLLVLLVMVRGSYAEAVPPLAGSAVLPPLLIRPDAFGVASHRKRRIIATIVTTLVAPKIATNQRSSCAAARPQPSEASAESTLSSRTARVWGLSSRT